jgi:hypothetical protein
MKYKLVRTDKLKAQSEGKNIYCYNCCFHNIKGGCVREKYIKNGNCVINSVLYHYEEQLTLSEHVKIL